MPATGQQEAQDKAQNAPDKAIKERAGLVGAVTRQKR